MRAYRLAHVAVEAETIRWKSMATRTVMRVAYALIALLFVIGVLVFAHIAAWFWLRTTLDQNFYAAACILGGADLIVALVFAFLASRSAPGRQEREALEVRRRAVQSIATALSVSQLAIPVLRMTNNMLRRARAS
jgi:hypothetical protein